MRNGTYTAKRRATSQEWRGNATRDFGATGNYGTFGGFSRNRNTIKFSGTGKLGKMTVVALVFGLLVNLGPIFVNQSAQGTSYDYTLADLNKEIDDLTARKEDLEAEQARLTSIANSNNSRVAAAMEDAGEAEFAE